MIESTVTLLVVCGLSREGEFSDLRLVTEVMGRNHENDYPLHATMKGFVNPERRKLK